MRHAGTAALLDTAVAFREPDLRDVRIQHVFIVHRIEVEQISHSSWAGQLENL